MSFSANRFLCRVGTILLFLVLFLIPVRADDIYVLSSGYNSGSAYTTSRILKITSTGVVGPFAEVPEVGSLAVNSTGNFYAVLDLGQLPRPVGDIATITNTGYVSYLQSGLHAHNPAIAIDADDNLFFVDDNTVYQVKADHTLNRIINIPGGSRAGPSVLAFDAKGDLYVAYAEGSIAKITTSNLPGPVSSTYFIARKNTSGSLTQKLTAWTKSVVGKDFEYAASMAFGPDGNLYVCSESSLSGTGIYSIFKVTPDGEISKFAECGNGIYSIAFDSAGILYVADAMRGNIYKVSANGVLTSFVTGLDGPFSMAIYPGLKLKPVNFTPAPNLTLLYLGLALFVILSVVGFWFSDRRAARPTTDSASNR